MNFHSVSSPFPHQVDAAQREICTIERIQDITAANGSSLPGTIAAAYSRNLPTFSPPRPPSELSAMQFSASSAPITRLNCLIPPATRLPSISPLTCNDSGLETVTSHVSTEFLRLRLASEHMDGSFMHTFWINRSRRH
ncbi:hypothetical protein I7I48_11153 [Histoplasma ohiense]|nr:hypothetical protein I7I48_11153 [Histoplasma ohiense (nom. inval.)]